LSCRSLAARKHAGGLKFFEFLFRELLLSPAVFRSLFENDRAHGNDTTAESARAAHDGITPSAGQQAGPSRSG